MLPDPTTTSKHLCDRVRLSWRSIIAGVVTTLAVSVVMGLLGMALGYTVVDPMSSEPASGLGMAFGIWSFISVIVCLAAGGFVAGLFTGVRGCEHGFIVWATVLLFGMLFTWMAIGAAVSVVGSAVQGAASAGASVVSGVGSMASSAAGTLQDNVDLDFDADAMADNVASVLRDTDVEVLQPSYLRQQMREARSDFRTMINQLRLDSDDSDSVISGFLERQKSRLENLRSNVDRNQAVNGLMRNRNLSRDEAEQAVDSALAAYDSAMDHAEDALSDAEQQVAEARQYMQQMADQARERAEEFTSAAAKANLMAALALIIGAIVSCLGGMLGNRYAWRLYP